MKYLKEAIAIALKRDPLLEVNKGLSKRQEDLEEIKHMADSIREHGISWLVTMWAETVGDYIGQNEMWDEAEGRITLAFLAAKKANVNLNQLNKQMEDYISPGDGWQLEEFTWTNKIAKKVFGRPILNIARVAAALGDDDDDGFEW